MVFASEIKTLSERATWLRQMLADLLVHRGDVACGTTGQLVSKHFLVVSVHLGPL